MLHILYHSATLIFLAAHIACGQDIYIKGGYSGEDVELPCRSNGNPPVSNKELVWWSNKGVIVGTFTEGGGFQASPGNEEQYFIDSLQGGLIIFNLNKAEDNMSNYTCGFVYADGTNFTDTDLVQLVVGYRPHNFHFQTNGSWRLGDCYENLWLNPITCSIVSDPSSEITWRIDRVVDGGIDCEDAIAESIKTYSCQNTTNVNGDTEYKCSSTLAPNTNCYGTYTCSIDYNLYDLYYQDDQCVATFETFDGEFLEAILYIFYACIILAFAIFLLVIALGLCGFISCGICTGLACICCKECDKSKTTVTPEHQAQSVRYKEPTAAYHMGNDVHIEPPPYSVN